MRTEIRIIEGGRPDSFKIFNSEPMPENLAKLRENREPWIRLHRDTFDDDGAYVKVELAVFTIVDDQIELEWRQIGEIGQPLTNVAPTNRYLVYEK